MKNLIYKKILYKSLNIEFTPLYCVINGVLINEKIKLKKNSLFYLKFLKINANNFYLLINKNYFKTFFSLFLRIIDGVSYGFKIILKLKGKGLRLQLKKKKEILQIYLKLGYSHKIFFKLPLNTWIYIFERRRSLILYSLNYSYLRMLLLNLRNYYPVNLYKIRGFFEPTEFIKQKKGNLD